RLRTSCGPTRGVVTAPSRRTSTSHGRRLAPLDHEGPASRPAPRHWSPQWSLALVKLNDEIFSAGTREAAKKNSLASSDSRPIVHTGHEHALFDQGGLSLGRSLEVEGDPDRVGGEGVIVDVDRRTAHALPLLA